MPQFSTFINRDFIQRCILRVALEKAGILLTCPRKKIFLKSNLTWKLGRCHKLIDLISPADEFEMHFKSLTSTLFQKIAVDSDQYIPVSFIMILLH